MNHLLIIELAQEDVAERVRTAQRERLARHAGQPARRGSSRVARASHAVRVALSDWRARTQLGALPMPMYVDETSDAPAR
jgi:hypothetical protein